MNGETGIPEMVKKDGSALKFFIGGIIFGTLVGGTVALLYAPMKGEDTRRMLKEKASNAEKMLQEKAFATEKMIQAKSMELKARAGEVIEDVKDKAMETKKRGENVLECIKQA